MELRTHRLSGARARRLVIVMLVAATPTIALGWAGCSSSSSNPAGGTGRVTVDPGGTFGADIGVTVIGRGRVTSSNVAGLDCPSSCYAGLVFGDRNQDGAASGVTLKAVATPGVRFAGWKFETASMGARGRGPELCNPVKRDTATPPLVDLNAAEITLPYGEAMGTPPAGQEAICAGYVTVPLAYSVTATFVDEIVDAGVDADGGANEVFVESPVTNAVGHAIGLAGGRLYWLYDVGGVSAIATSSTFTGATPQTIPGTSGFFSVFEIGQHVVWYSSGNLNVIQGGNTFVTTFSTGGNACVAVESDFSNVFCRTAGPSGSLISWSTAGTNMTTLHSGLPTGTDFTVDSSGFSLVDTTNSTFSANIVNIPRTASPDAGMPTLTIAVSGLENPTQLETNSSRLFWIADNGGSGIAQSAFRTGGTAFSSTPTTTGLRALATDPQSTSSFFVAVAPSSAAGASQIVKLSSSSSFPTMVRQNLTGVGGVTADSSYVYWTQNDGRVYRAARTTF